jgi:uncharacterized protein (TIGR02246 family)
MNDADILRTVLDRWKSAVDAHDPERVATYFTDEAIFQGLRPYGIGRRAVAEYYDGQPIGLTATYDLRETRRLADDLLLGYSAVEFTFPDRPPLTGRLCVLARQVGASWLIDHYQVSRLD